MVSPIITDRFRAQVILQGKTNMPDDVYVNTFGFRNDGIATKEAMADGIAVLLDEFYNDPITQTGQALTSFMAGTLIQNEALIKVYDLGEATPRQVLERELTLALPGGAAFPPEVCATLSFYGTRNLPRQRGRIYLGPLTQSTVELVNSSYFFTPAFRETAAHAMRRLAQTHASIAATWHVISPTSVDSHEVTHGWVDNAPDTQRRRGVEPTSRYTWSSVGVEGPV